MVNTLSKVCRFSFRHPLKSENLFFSPTRVQKALGAAEDTLWTDVCGGEEVMKTMAGYVRALCTLGAIKSPEKYVYPASCARNAVSGKITFA